MTAKIAPNGVPVVDGRGITAVRNALGRGANQDSSPPDKDVLITHREMIGDLPRIVIGPVGHPARTCDVASIAKIDHINITVRSSVRCRRLR